MKIIENTNFLSTFKIQITSGQPRIYNNGHQQIEITVTYQPAKNVELSEEQLNSLRLVTSKGGEFQELSDEFTVSTTRDPRFKYFQDPRGPSNVRAPEVIAGQNIKTFYISSTHEAEVPINLHAAMNKDDDLVAITGTKYFNSSCIITTVNPDLILSRQDFKFWGEDVHEEDLSSWHAGQKTTRELDVDVYHLSFKDPRNRLVESVKAEEGTVGEGEPWFHKKFEADASWFFDSRESRIHTHIAYTVGTKLSFSNEHITINVSRRNVMNFVRVKIYEKHPSFPVSVKTVNERSVWLLRDQNGNTHKIEMFTESNGNIPNFKVIESHYYDRLIAQR
ncbi:hypothetical protein [Pseudomonas sp. Pseu.R1]|uniref:hypothetical protein n=1 Tax=Pseudomonas sp. Pseu.R1 TaxID=3379818 RepID=UPI003B95CD33